MSDKIVLLDGGMGQELIHRSKMKPTALWSAHVMLHEPEIVEAVHREYIAAGAKVLTLNAYCATPERLARDLTIDLFHPLQAKAVEIANSAKGDNQVSVAGCLSPLYGSYKPEADPDFEKYLETYRQVVRLQQDHVEVFLCETMSSINEVKAATQACAESGKPAWIGMSVLDQDGTKLRSGEDLEAGAKAAVEAGASALLINCSWPEAVSQGLEILKQFDLPFGGYANGFTNAAALELGGTVDHLTAREDLGPEQYTNHVLGWLDQGATIVGGCCEVGPAHIQHISDTLKAKGFEISGV